MSRILIIADTDGGFAPLHVTAGADLDVLQTNSFLQNASVFGVDYEADDYVTYVQILKDKVEAGRDHWTPEDIAAAERTLTGAVAAIRRNYGRDLAEAAPNDEALEKARALGLLPQH